MTKEYKQSIHAGAWEGRMSESKAEYYAKHLEQQGTILRDRDGLPLSWTGTMETIQPTEQPTGLPTLLARMVGEYTKELCLHISSDISGGMALAFNRTLLECAQPALAEYLHTITTPPKFVMKQQLEDYIKAEQAIEMSRAGYSDLARKHLGLDEEDNPFQQGKVSALIDALNKNEREADRIRSGKL